MKRMVALGLITMAATAYAAEVDYSDPNLAHSNPMVTEAVMTCVESGERKSSMDNCLRGQGVLDGRGINEARYSVQAKRDLDGPDSELIRPTTRMPTNSSEFSSKSAP